VTRSTLRYGIYLPPMGPLGDPVALVDLAVRAEAAGWDGVFLWDHVLTAFPPIADTWTTLGAIAGATQSIRLGPMVTPLPRRRPWVVARQASTVSRLSGGRLILGSGLGADETGDFARFGEAEGLAERKVMLDDGLDIVRAMWSGSAWRHHGSHYDVEIEEADPEPHRIPIWMAGSNASRAVLARAAKCDGIYFNPDGHEATPEEVAALLEGLRGAGLPADAAFDVAVRGNASSAWPDPAPKDVDLAGLAEAGATWWMEALIYFDPLDMSLDVVDAGPPGV
jgi:alkanesulfonate monooxygenase SsuD/methylene tetrahydromethanopterin reductase-like flavin-dependent oxidoreductase (luciferase family)